MYTRMNRYFSPILCNCRFGFGGGHSAQRYLLIMIEKWRASLDRQIDLPSLKLLSCYLRNRRQRVKINNFYSPQAEILFGVPQGSILGPILFNIFLCDLFLFIKSKGVASHADDTTSYDTGGNSAYVIHNFEVLQNTLLNWFINSMKANPGKYHLILSGNDSSKITVGNETISSSKCEKLWRIKIDSYLNFKEHILNLCVKKQVKKLMLFLDFHNQ